MDVRRPWYSIRWHECLQLAAVLTIALAAVVWLDTQRRIAEIPEPGRATPIEELRAAWAEPDEIPAKRTPFTMPQPRQERRP